MNAIVHMYQIGWDIKAGQRILKLVAEASQNQQVLFANPIAIFAIMHHSKVKWSMDKCILMK